MAQPRRLAPISLQPKVKELQNDGNVSREKSSLSSLKKQQKNSLPAEKVEKEKDEKVEFKGKASKQSISFEQLQEGYAQSYTDFFYLTHYCVPQLIRPSDKFKEEFENNLNKYRTYEQNEVNLKSIKQSLKKAEDYLSNQDYDNALDTYNRLADDFIINYDEYHFAAYFFKRCISIARTIPDLNWESLAKMGFAKCHDLLDRPDDAISLLEDAVDQASDQRIMGRVSREQVQNYKKMAEKYEYSSDDVSGKIQLALNYYEKCQKACQRAEMVELEGQISHRIGMIYLKHGEYEKSIEHQKIYLANSKQLDKENAKKNEMDAHASLAQCYMKINDIESAQKHLEQYFEIAKQSGSSNKNSFNAQADAAHHLADLQWKKGNVQEALKWYKTFFENAKNEKERKSRVQIDNARIALGLAKGTHEIETFMDMITDSKDNIQPLIEWKLKKEKS